MQVREWRKRPSVRSRAIFFRTLSLFSSGGIPLHRALRLLSLDPDEPMAEVSRAVATRLDRGESLSQAMAAHYDVFSGLQSRLVRVGEISGSVHVVLRRLAEFEEKQLMSTARARAALTYPAVLLLICLLMVTIVPPYLFGGLYPIIESSGVQVWWPTRCLMALSQALRSPWFLVLGLGAAGGIAALIRRLAGRPRVRRVAMAWLLRVPGLGRTLRTLAVTRFAQALALMVQVGVPIVSALELAGQSSDNPVLEERMPDAIRALVNGSALSVSLQVTEFFPKLVLLAVNVGQDSGALGGILEKLAEIYEVQLEHDLETLAAMAEPLIVMFLGAVVAVVTLASLVPLVQVIQTL
ncbi:MAG: type II secretion system F family protein [Armatimonadetes bacterium]|nr:type II secretion system F family protein [Armatimonadota bacterium]